MESQPSNLNDGLLKNFILWVDGVGGYLVCASNSSVIGQATPDSTAEIPIRGDIDQVHATIQVVDGQHVLHPNGVVTVAGKVVRQPTLLLPDQTFRMGDSVELGYRKPHPFSSTAVIDFTSRHRTYPWSDAVLLAGDTIVLGPESRNHIVCPDWNEELILFRRGNAWFCKSTAELEIDTVSQAAQVPLAGNSRIVGNAFSLSLEAVAF